jgi:YD repeat-containing protein
MPARALCALALVLGALLLPSATASAATCPNSNFIVQENNCAGTGTSDYQLGNDSTDVAGFATKTSFAKGENVPLKIARNLATFGSRVDITVYRTGYYGGEGARLIPAAGATNVAVNNNFTCNSMNMTTGEYSCANWGVTYTIPGSSLPGTGVYEAKIHTRDTNVENRIVFIVRDDNRTTDSKVLVVLPTATWQAYNTFGGKSLYFDKFGLGNTISGTQRAVEVSFDRPLDNDRDRDGYFGPDYDAVQWLEREGYDVSYTDDVAVHENPAELKQHKIVLITGHSEYWSLEQFNGFKAAIASGTNITSLSANTAYWKIRYENGDRSMVCFKTVQGDGSGGSGRVTPNDFGPDHIVGTADDALGLDQKAGTADDHPENATTTFRDDGAPDGDLNAPVGGRVGPNMPENQLFGVMYVGDNDDLNYDLTVPGSMAGDRTWRNAGLPTNTATKLGDGTVGWEWDAVPTQAQYLAKQPAGVVKLSATDTTAGTPSWLLDEGRQRALIPPSPQPGTVNAVRYTAPSGAKVFASGTMQWSWGLSEQDVPAIQQATYNILSDMGVKPDTPDGITQDPAGSNTPPTASFTWTPTTVKPNQAASFNASSSSDPGGSIVRYEWDWDGDGTFDQTTTSSSVTHTYTVEGNYDVRLRVTDNGGATDLTVRTVTVLGNIAPTASFTVSPTPAVVSQTVTFNASASSDSDGTITKYEWDLDGNGTYETNTGTTKTTTKAYTATGTFTIGLRVTDNGGKTATATMPLTINSGGVSRYSDNILDTAGLVDYWRLGETAGPTAADSKGASPATITGGTFGVPGGVAFDPNTAVRFNGGTDWGRAAVNLSSTSKVTVEFWLNVARYTDTDGLAFELTDNFNANSGGFLIDPDAPQGGGKFGIGIGSGSSRNNVFFDRKPAGEWHHYAIVMDSTAPAATQIVPYVDGVAVPYTKQDSGTGAGNFAQANLYFMSRAGSGLFGAGDLDEVSLYNQALSQATIQRHFGSYGTNAKPNARFTTTPNPAATGQTVTFNGSTSSDPDGSITKYEWDLDGNGTYETSTGSTPTVTKSYATEQTVSVGLRVTDNLFGTATTTNDLFVGNKPPTASFTATPNPAIKDQVVTYNAAGSSDVDGTITKYEWDLDGNGSYETDTGTTKTATKSYSTTGTRTIGLRVTDNGGKTATTTVPVTVNSGGVSSYGDAVLGTAGLRDYYRLGEASGTTLADSKGTSPGTLASGTLGVAGAVANDPNTAVSFNGTTNSASVPLNLSGTNKLTVEFWLKVNSYNNSDQLAMEFTPNFNAGPGGFIVDPDAPQYGGTFGVGLGQGGSRNNVFFARPSAGAWHHYALVMDTSQPAATQITPYVDGQAVSYQKLDTGTGAGNFSNSTLYLASRAGSSLFLGGSLDELAIYNTTLDADTINTHFGSSGTNRKPTAALSVSPTALRPGSPVTFSAAGSSDPDGSITRYEWDLDGDGAYETDTGSSATTTKTYTAEQSLTVKVRVTDNAFGTDVASKAIVIGNQPPTAAFSYSPSTVNVNQATSFDASASADADGSIAKYEWDFDGDGTYDVTTTSATTSRTFTSAGSRTVTLRVTDNEGKTATVGKTVNVRAQSYPATIAATAGLVSYWRMDSAAGGTIPDSAGSSPATLFGGTTGVSGGLGSETSPAIRFNGTSDYARAALNLSGTSKVTLEFWLKWNAFADDDDLAMEFTDNFNGNSGGILVDPNGGNGDFGVGIGSGDSRNNVYFTRPSAGAWHHYVIVMDSTAPAASQITPYVDGQPVTYYKTASGTGAGNFANANLYLMSRAGSLLFGAGDLDEVSVYNTALSAATVSAHYAAGQP